MINITNENDNENDNEFDYMFFNVGSEFIYDNINVYGFSNNFVDRSINKWIF